MGTGIRWLYVTTAHPEQAQAIASQLLTERKIACANILPQMQSVYEWKGEVQTDSESVLILKTSEERTREVMDRVVELHDYECPCVLAFDIQDGHEEFLRWIKNEVRSS